MREAWRRRRRRGPITGASDKSALEPTCVQCGSEARPLPTPERKRLSCDSVCAISKRDQEELCLVVGRSYGVRTVALRFFNVFGPRQSLSNPYTGVAVIFVSRLLNSRAPTIFEDGLQSRDFVHVVDIARAIELALEARDVGDIALNVGTGRHTTVLDVAGALSAELGLDLRPDVLHQFRHGDIRHCYADIGLAREKLGYAPGVSFRQGMKELVAWIRASAPPADDSSDRSTAELLKRGLVV
jgi:dTDP-L-rhamnose 4-epimerase